MSYKLLYIEDLDPGSIMHELSEQGFDMSFYEPVKFEDTIDEIMQSEFDAILIDFRLTGKQARFDAPTIAQTIRTKSTIHHKFIPIFLVSSEGNISDYYKDFTSHDLFDISFPKAKLLSETEKYSKRFISFIEAYKTIKVHNFNFCDILGINDEKFNKIDYRLSEKLKTKQYIEDIYAISNFIYKEVIKSIGILIGEDILSARLGINKQSNEWGKILDLLSDYKYKGVFSDAYDRWWSDEIEDWWKSISDVSIRRLNSIQRVDIIKNATSFNELIAIEKIQYENSSNFWTVCKQLNVALDPIDGLELYLKEQLPWQEKEYISILAALKGSPLYRYVKPADKKKYQAITKNA